MPYTPICVSLTSCYQRALRSLAEVDRIQALHAPASDVFVQQEAVAKDAKWQLHCEVKRIRFQEASAYYGMPKLQPTAHRFAGTEIAYLEYCQHYARTLDIYQAGVPAGCEKQFHERARGNSEPLPMSKEMRQVYHIISSDSSEFIRLIRMDYETYWRTKRPIPTHVALLHDYFAKVDVPIAQIQAALLAEAARKAEILARCEAAFNWLPTGK